MGTIVEYLGLPAVGKSWCLSRCLGTSLVKVPASQGVTLAKLTGSARGALYHPLQCLLAACCLVNLRSPFLIGSQFRSWLVLMERLERSRLLRISREPLLHLDEGVLQAIWSLFFHSRKNRLAAALLRSMLRGVSKTGDLVMYVACPRHIHEHRILNRRKTTLKFIQPSGGLDAEAYRSGRWWMACLLQSIRRGHFSITSVRNF